MQLSPNFSLAEFTVSEAAERIGDTNSPTPQHLANLHITAAGFEIARHILGDCAIVLTSGYRNTRVNKLVGGVRTSAHTLGFGGDFHAAAIPPLSVARQLAAAMRDGRIKFDQLILESSRNICHLSFDPRLRCEVKTQALAAGSSVVFGLPN